MGKSSAIAMKPALALSRKLVSSHVTLPQFPRLPSKTLEVCEKELSMDGFQGFHHFDDRCSRTTAGSSSKWEKETASRQSENCNQCILLTDPMM